MKRLAAILYPGELRRWLVAFNPETDATSQGRTMKPSVQNLKEATELHLEEDLPQRAWASLTPFEVAQV